MLQMMRFQVFVQYRLFAPKKRWLNCMKGNARSLCKAEYGKVISVGQAWPSPTSSSLLATHLHFGTDRNWSSRVKLPLVMFSRCSLPSP